MTASPVSRCRRHAQDLARPTPDGYGAKSRVDGLYNQSYRLPPVPRRDRRHASAGAVYFMRSVRSTAGPGVLLGELHLRACAPRRHRPVAYLRELLHQRSAGRLSCSCCRRGRHLDRPCNFWRAASPKLLWRPRRRFKTYVPVVVDCTQRRRPLGGRARDLSVRSRLVVKSTPLTAPIQAASLCPDHGLHSRIPSRRSASHGEFDT